MIRKEYRESRRAQVIIWILVGVHASLLIAALPDYIADNDLGYHISLGRQYGEHGTYFWDSLNWAPTGRPNLQGPLLHLSIGVLGRILGGQGDSYVLAFCLLAILQWLVAVGTTYWFSRRWGGDWAALFAVALLTGCIWSAGPFFVGVPSGWIFILTPWAIHFFLLKRYVLATAFNVAVMFVHLGGSPVAPLGIFLAAAFERDWKGLAKVGFGSALLASPYLIHFLVHLDWYNGQRGHVAGDFAILTYVLALPGLFLLLRRPREYRFLLIWLVAPVAWFFQDNLRFFLQSTPVASTIAGIFVAFVIQGIPKRVLQATTSAVFVLLATLFPLSIPSLPIEAVWAMGLGFPRELDWREAKTLARVMKDTGTGERIVNSYYDSLSAAMAVYQPLRQEYGHWGEVRPRVNPARDIPAGEKLYVLPLPAGDEVLRRLEEEGRIEVLGGSERTSLALLGEPGSSQELRPVLSRMIRSECLWLAANAVNNRLPPPRDLFYPSRIEEFRRVTTLQRIRVGRIQVAVLILAHAYEKEDPEFARRLREGARGWGSLANFVGDETAIDYLDDQRFERFRGNLIRLGEAVVGWADGTVPLSEADRVTGELFDDFFG